jgi:uncharacterized membrane protein
VAGAVKQGYPFLQQRIQREGEAVAIILIVVVPLVVVLYALIFWINQGTHYAPQAYYRRKTAGATVAFGFESLAPRHRKPPPGEDGVDPR